MPDSTDPDRDELRPLTPRTASGTPEDGAPPEDGEAAGGGVSGWKRIAAVLAVGAAGAFFGYREINDRITNIHEIDARVQADLITISSRVAGWVTDISVAEGDTVEAAQVVMTIDARQSELRLSDLESQLARVGAEKARAQAERRLADKKTASRLASERARMAAASVVMSSMAPQLDLARREHARAQSLFDRGVASRRQLDEAETALNRTEREHRIAAADLKAAEAEVAEALANRERLAVLDSELEIFIHREGEITAQLEEQRLDMKDRTIRAPISGLVDKTFVEAGEYVTPGQRLALIHDPDRIWIDANIKETDVRKLKIGDKARVAVDAYPGQVFEGWVTVIGGATTASFALLPSPNPSGNFTKITQRLPVKIAIPQRDRLLKPGMMVEIKIDVDQAR